MNPHLSDAEKKLLNKAAELRGSIITSFAQVEFTLADLAVKCKRFSEYNVLVKKFPYKLEQRLKTVHKLIAAPGPLAVYREEMQALVDRILEFEELRHFMAHGLIIVASDRHTLQYWMYRPGRSNHLQLQIIKTNIDQLSRDAEKIASYAQSMMELFQKIYLEQGVERTLPE